MSNLDTITKIKNLYLTLLRYLRKHKLKVILNLNLLRNSPISDAYYEHLEKSNNVYYIKEGGGYGSRDHLMSKLMSFFY